MKKDELLEALREYKDQHFQKYGIKSMGIFGSVAREENTETSDIDIVVALQKPDLFVMGNIKLDIEEAFGRSVDIVCRGSRMNPYLAKCIDRDVIYV